MIYTLFEALYTSILFAAAPPTAAGAVYITTLTIISCSAVLLLPVALVIAVWAIVRRLYKHKYWR